MIISNFKLILQKNLTLGLVIFYIDIEFTGANHQFYTKHEYRHYLMNIFEVLWELEEYRIEMKSISKDNAFERFINLIMNDTTYCMDEGINGLIKSQELQAKKNQGQPLTEEEEKSLENFGNSSTYYLQHAGECIKVLQNLSQWSPNSFLTESLLFCLFVQKKKNNINSLQTQIGRNVELFLG